MAAVNTNKFSRALLTASALFIFSSLGGCASFSVPDSPPEEFVGRAEVQDSGGVEVRAAVLSEEEAKAHFSTRLPRKQIQPVWLQIENRRDEVLLLNSGTMEDFRTGNDGCRGSCLDTLAKNCRLAAME